MRSQIGSYHRCHQWCSWWLQRSLVSWQGHGHTCVVRLDLTIDAINGVLGGSKDLLSLGKVLLGSNEVKPFLHLCDFTFTLFKFNSNGFKTNTITFPCSLGVI